MGRIEMDGATRGTSERPIKFINPAIASSFRSPQPPPATNNNKFEKVVLRIREGFAASALVEDMDAKRGRRSGNLY